MRSGGNDSSLIRDLLYDAQILERLKVNLLYQGDRLAEFREQYLSDSAQTIYEVPPIQVKRKIMRFGEEADRLERRVKQQLDLLASSSQEMIQLVILSCFNRADYVSQ